jgi:hypothetical protein
MRVLRKDNDDPNETASRMEMRLLYWELPIHDILLPNLQKLLADRVEPIDNQSMMVARLPNLDHERTEREEPEVRACVTENGCGRTILPAIDIALPTRIHVRTENEEPTAIASMTVNL